MKQQIIVLMVGVFILFLATAAIGALVDTSKKVDTKTFEKPKDEAVSVSPGDLKPSVSRATDYMEGEVITVKAVFIPASTFSYSPSYRDCFVSKSGALHVGPGKIGNNEFIDYPYIQDMGCPFIIPIVLPVDATLVGVEIYADFRSTAEGVCSLTADLLSADIGKHLPASISKNAFDEDSIDKFGELTRDMGGNVAGTGTVKKFYLNGKNSVIDMNKLYRVAARLKSTDELPEQGQQNIKFSSCSVKGAFLYYTK